MRKCYFTVFSFYYFPLSLYLSLSNFRGGSNHSNSSPKVHQCIAGRNQLLAAISFLALFRPTWQPFTQLHRPPLPSPPFLGATGMKTLLLTFAPAPHGHTGEDQSGERSRTPARRPALQPRRRNLTATGRPPIHSWATRITRPSGCSL